MRKNRYCVNSKLSEQEFELLVWRYCYVDNQSEAKKMLSAHGCTMSRQTINRFSLMLGDYYFQKTVANMAVFNRGWHVDCFAMYAALYPQSIRVEFSSEFLGKTEIFRGDRFRVGIFQHFKNYSKRRKGIPLARFCSHLGTISAKMRFGTRLINSGVDVARKFQEEYYYSVLNDLIGDPLNPKVQISFVYNLRGNVLEVQEYCGSSLEKTDFFVL